MATMNGAIKRLTDKGFGFIAASDGSEYFFHQSACRDIRPEWSSEDSADTSSQHRRLKSAGRPASHVFRLRDGQGPA